MSRPDRVNPTLDGKAISFLRASGREIRFSEGDLVLRQGQQGEFFYVISSGTVTIGVRSSEGERLWLYSLGVGNFFGEISLLLDGTVTFDVVATDELTVVACRKDAFFDILNRTPSLGAVLSQSLASRLSLSTTDLWTLHQQRKALNTLMGYHRKTAPLVDESASMKILVREVGECRRKGARAILVHGPAGAGKGFVASVIHNESMQDHDPFIVVDCRSFCSEDVTAVLFGDEFSMRESLCATDGGAYRSLGAVDLADGGTFVLKHVDALSLASQEKILEYLSGLYDKHVSPFQLIATSRKEPEELKRDGLLHPGIEEMFGSFSIRVPSLRERKRDILPLAVHFLRSCEGNSMLRLSPAAEKKLLSLDYHNRNATELKEMIEFAVQVSEGVEIEEGNLFAAGSAGDSTVEFNLQRSPTVRWLTRPKALAEARAIVLISFLAVVALSVFKGRSPSGQIANAVIWSLWEPLLFASFFVAGRIWCTVCPISTAGKAFSGVLRLNRPPPDWLKKGSAALLMAGFASIIWAEHYFTMQMNPFPSGMLLLALFLLAFLFTVVYQRETWCRYACPLGGLGAAYAGCASLTVKANSDICANYCRTHECYKGSARADGCPVFRHPLHGAEAHNCKMCLSCLSDCPHGASHLYLRPPLMNAWKGGALDESITLFSFFIFFFGPAMLASRGPSWAGTHAGFGLTTLAAVLLAVLCHGRVHYLLSGYEGMKGLLVSRLSLGLLVLAWGPLMAYQMVNIRGLNLLVLHIREGSEGLMAIGEVSLLVLLQAVFIAGAGLLSAIVCWRIRHEAEPFLRSRWDPGWKILALLCAGYVFLNVCIAAL